MRNPRVAWILAAVGIGAYSPALAHIELTEESAAAGSDFRAIFVVEHGCAGAATTAIRIQLDSRIVEARPMAKPGWKAQITTQLVKQPDGKSLQVPHEISWTGGTIAGDFYDEFQMLVALPNAAAGTVLYFPVIQECGGTTVRWIEMPLAGEDPDTLDSPAPSVTLTDGKSAAHESNSAH